MDSYQEDGTVLHDESLCELGENEAAADSQRFS